MAKYDKAGVSLTLDTSEFDSGYKGVLADAGKLDALAPTVKVNVTDTELKTAVDLVGDLDTSTSLKVNVDDSEITNVSDQLNTLTAIGAIDLAINVAGSAKGFIEGLGRFSGLGGLMEMDNALALIEARTGKMIPGAEKLITDLYTNGWGESRTQIAEVIGQADNLKISGDNMSDAVENALILQATYGSDTTETLRTMDSLVKNGLAPNFDVASDILVTGMQNGADRGQDLLDTFNEYGSTFGQLRISGEGALSLINSGLDAGVDNSDRIADSIREAGIRLGEMGTDPKIQEAFDRLDELSDVDLAQLKLDYDAGKISGDEFWDGFFSAFSDANATNPEEATGLATTLIGTQSEDFKIGAISQLTTEWDETMGVLEGRTDTAGVNISDSLGVTVDTFLRNIEQMATDFLSSDAIDLDGKIDTFKTQLQDAMAVAMNGGSLGDALEVGFGVTGVDAALANVSRVFGQFVITLLEIVAAIQDPLGINDADKGTRGEITRLATAQLPFDLQVANPDEFDAIFTQAAQRGVSLADMGAALTTALDASVAEGDFERTKEILANIMADPDVDPATVQALVDKYNAAIDEAMAASKPPAEADGWWNRLKPPAELDTAKAFSTPTGAGAKGTNWWDTIEVSPETIASLDEADNAVVTLDKNVDTAMTNASLVTTLASQEMIDALSAMSDGVVTADEEIYAAIEGNTMTASFEAMSASADQNVEATKASFQELLATVSQVDVRMSAFFNGIMAKVSAVNSAIEGIGTVPTGGGGGNTVNNTTVNVNQTNNVQGNAQAAQAGYQLGAQIRGMA